jgi:hypothetical protein
VACSAVHITNNKNPGASGEDFMPIGPIAKNDPSALDVAAVDQNEREPAKSHRFIMLIPLVQRIG